MAVGGATLAGAEARGRAGPASGAVTTEATHTAPMTTKTNSASPQAVRVLLGGGGGGVSRPRPAPHDGAGGAAGQALGAVNRDVGYPADALASSQLRGAGRAPTVPDGSPGEATQSLDQGGGWLATGR